MFKNSSGGGFYLDELMYLIGYILGRGFICVLGFLTGYIGINVLIGVLRWLALVLF